MITITIFDLALLNYEILISTYVLCKIQRGGVIIEIFVLLFLTTFKMRIPQSIDPLVLDVYTTSIETLNLIGEYGVKIFPDDFVWDNDEIPTLASLCVRKIAFYFDERPWFHEVPCEDRDHLLELISLKVPLEITIPLIESENYWRRRYENHFGSIIHPKPKVWNWKSLYVEREIQRIIEQAEPQYKDEESMEDILRLCAPFVKKLMVTQLSLWKPPLTISAADAATMWDIYPIDHIDFNPILKHLPLVEEFDLTFGMNNVAFDFCWDMFKVTVKDCQLLGQAIQYLPELKILRIHKSTIEDKHIQALITGLIKNESLVELDLSNCRIGDKGALCISKLLSTHPNLRKLNLANNLIGRLGAEGIGFALLQETCPPLESLYLSLNPLGRHGTVGVLRALVRCSIPTELAISAVHFEDDLPDRVPQMLTVNYGLKILDCSANWFGEKGGENLIDALEGNTTLEWLDLRETGITTEQDLIIKKLLQRNRLGHLEVEMDEESVTDKEEVVEEERDEFDDLPQD